MCVSSSSGTSISQSVMERCVSRSVCHENFLALAATSLVIGVSSGVLCADFGL